MHSRRPLVVCAGRAGVPMEVMGLMLGQFVDEYTVNCVDVFAMPQSGTGVSVEAVDPVFQTQMLEMLKQTGRPEMVVGWYHSHPGFGCWMSGVDINTQQVRGHHPSTLAGIGSLASRRFLTRRGLPDPLPCPRVTPFPARAVRAQSFEQLNPRAVAVVIDPVQSVKGKVVIDCFRIINPQAMMLGQEPRQSTSNVGLLKKPSIQVPCTRRQTPQTGHACIVVPVAV
jgi:26S proteasome regulatory subunit N11